MMLDDGAEGGGGLLDLGEDALRRAVERSRRP
jgi:hypothetical protein